LAVLTVALGVSGPWINGFLHEVFEKYFTQSLGLVVSNAGSTAIGSGSEMLMTEIFIAVSSVSMIIIGAVPAYRTYIAHKSSPEDLVKRHTSLQALQKFLWNRWYIDAFYNKIFVDGALSMRDPLAKYVEDNLDRALNVGVPSIFAAAYNGLKKIQTGIISINMGYFMLFIVAMLLILLLLGVL
jgi:NADH-quinone oxidoreductase subunit L